MWNDLPMSQKALIIKWAVLSGITSIDVILKLYDSVLQIRLNAYDTINPFTDYNIDKNLREYLNGEIIDYGDKIHQDNTGHNFIEYMDGHADIEAVDDIWATYLSIPENKRRFKTRLQQSEYRPTQGAEDTPYYKLPLTQKDIDNLLEETNDLPVNSNKLSGLLEYYNLADHTVGRGHDEKGEYRSYYDKWDINPFVHKYLGTLIPGLSGLGDASFGIGTPVNIYDRIYLDEYHGFKEPTHSTWLPEVEVEVGEDASNNKGNKTKDELTIWEELFAKEKAEKENKKGLGGPLVAADGGNTFLIGGPKGRLAITNLSTWDEMAALLPIAYTLGKLLDPTGITGYSDTKEAWKEFKNKPALNTGYNTVMETLGSLPVIGRKGKILKTIQGLVTGQGALNDWNHAKEMQNAYNKELVVDYWDNTVKPREEAYKHSEQIKKKMSYTEVNHLPAFYLAPKGTKVGDILPNYNINNALVEKYKNKHAFGGPLVDTANAHIYDGTTEDSQQMNNDDYIYTGAPSQYDFQVTALKPTVHWDGFNWIGYNDLGLRVTKGPNFNPLNANILEDPVLFENARLALALKTDINRTHAFAEDIRNFTTDLVMMPTGDVIAEPLGIIGKNVVKMATKPVERYNLADKVITAGRNIWSKITEPYYINKIHGKNLLGNWNENVATGVSDDIQQFMIDNVVNRNVRELLNAGKRIYALNYADRALNLMQNAKVGQYSLRDYTKAGWDNVSGLYNGDNFISLNKDLSNVDNTYKHEVHHLLDRHNNLLESQLELLNKAYDETFENLTFNRGEEILSKEALRDEKLTLNSDARNLIVGKETDLTKQDAIIDNTSDEDIFKAIRKSGEYGRRFINYLRKHDGLTPEKASYFREAMKHVGSYAVPTIMGGIYTNTLNTNR